MEPGDEEGFQKKEKAFSRQITKEGFHK